jgi:feruloyl-CoA synthase
MEHFSPLVRDVVIAGEGRSELAALVFPAAGFSRQKFDSLFKTLAHSGSSNRIARLLIFDEPPSLDAGEVTDKGTINQKAVLSRRRKLVDELYRKPPEARDEP